MTTTVIVQAHCAPDKEVVIRVRDRNTGENVLDLVTIQDGEEHRCVAFDDRVVTVEERHKL